VQDLDVQLDLGQEGRQPREDHRVRGDAARIGQEQAGLCEIVVATSPGAEFSVDTSSDQPFTSPKSAAVASSVTVSVQTPLGFSPRKPAMRPSG
jgi:hypothetical protein